MHSGCNSLAFAAVRLDLHAAIRFECRFALASTVLPNACIVEAPSSKAVHSSMPPSCPSSLLQRHIHSHGPSFLPFRRIDNRSHHRVFPAFAQDSSLGVAKDPLRRTPCSPSTPARFGSRMTFPLTSTTTCQSCCSFRSCRSSRLQRFTPVCTSRAYCIPQPIMGFTTFPVVSHVCRSPDRAERSRSSVCRFSLIPAPEGHFHQLVFTVCSRKNCEELQELSMKTEVTPFENDVSSSVEQCLFPKDKTCCLL